MELDNLESTKRMPNKILPKDHVVGAAITYKAIHAQFYGMRKLCAETPPVLSIFFAGFFFEVIRLYQLWVENRGKCCSFFCRIF